MKFSVISCLLLAVVCNGDEACDERQDAALPDLQASLNKTESYEMNVQDPCTKCRVWNLGTVFRAVETNYEKTSDGSYKHAMTFGFGTVRALCDCELQSGAKTVQGQTDTLWSVPRITTDMIMNAEKKTCIFQNTNVLNDMRADTTVTCVGSDDWKQTCDPAAKDGVFDNVNKKACEQLFPNESTKQVENDDSLMTNLNCEHVA